jgi:hypothetical protein
MYRIRMCTGNLGIRVPTSCIVGLMSFAYKTQIQTIGSEVMYPANFDDNSVYAPKPTRPGAIQNEHSSRFRPTRTPLASLLGSQKIQHMPRREIVWPHHLETILLEGKIFTTIEYE